MDDFVLANLNESRNEWCSRLITILSPRIAEGIQSIFNEAWKLTVENKEMDKYLMTFQNFLCAVPKWNANTIEDERQRIIEKSGCNFLEDLITCVHIIQLKILTSVRVGNRQKKIDIAIPKLNDFIHRVYVNTASKVYRNAYLFDKTANALTHQKHMRELEKIIEECILKTIRDSIPTEQIVKAYLDESVEQEEEVIVENIVEPALEKPIPVDGEENKAPDIETTVPELKPEPEFTVPTIENVDSEPVVTRLTFNDIDSAIDIHGAEEKIQASKDVDRLEQLGMERHLQRKMEEEAEAEEDSLKIGDDLSGFDLGIMDMDAFGEQDKLSKFKTVNESDPLNLLGDIETL